MMAHIFPPRILRAAAVLIVVIFLLSRLRSSVLPSPDPPDVLDVPPSRGEGDSTTDTKPAPSPPVDSSSPAKDTGFWSKFHEILIAAKPECGSPERIEAHPPAVGFNPANIDNTSLPEYIVVTPEIENCLKESHTKFINLLSQSDRPKLDYNPGTKGIVSTAGGPLIPVFLLTLHMLRESGSKLPVELFLADRTEYDEFVCETMLPRLNAKCLVLSDFLSASHLINGLEKYQFKIFSLIFSSFDKFIFIDADDFPVRDPTYLFDSEPFLSHGLIAWPDFWKVTYHKSFFDVTSQPIPTSFNHASVESGQLAVSKSSHEKMLLLSTYYNLYGPTHFYPLLSQGAPGEGDKETFVVAAKRLNLPAYEVRTGPGVLGRFKPDGEFEGSGILQADPMWDSRNPADPAFGWRGTPEPPASEVLFLHVNYPKLNPNKLFGPDKHALDAEGNARRVWAPDAVQKVGKDIEPIVWKGLKSIICTLENDDNRSWDGGMKYCGKMDGYIQQLFGTI